VHHAAVAAALAHLEEQVGWLRQGAGGRHTVKGRGFVAAAFRHRASRDRIHSFIRMCWSPTQGRPTSMARLRSL